MIGWDTFIGREACEIVNWYVVYDFIFAFKTIEKSNLFEERFTVT